MAHIRNSDRHADGRTDAKDQVGHTAGRSSASVRPFVRLWFFLNSYCVGAHFSLVSILAWPCPAWLSGWLVCLAAPGVGEGQNAKHQPVMIHPSISPSPIPLPSSPLLSSPLLTGDGQHAADRPEREEGGEAGLPSLPPLTHSHSRSASLSWSPCGDLARPSVHPPAFPLSLHLFVLSRAI